MDLNTKESQRMNKSLTSNDVLNVSRLNLSMTESEKNEEKGKRAVFSWAGKERSESLSSRC